MEKKHVPNHQPVRMLPWKTVIWLGRNHRFHRISPWNMWIPPWRSWDLPVFSASNMFSYHNKSVSNGWKIIKSWDPRSNSFFFQPNLRLSPRTWRSSCFFWSGTFLRIQMSNQINSGDFNHVPSGSWHFLFMACSYGPLPVISTYNPIYRIYNPIYNQL
jgi:hypothetical protein